MARQGVQDFESGAASRPEAASRGGHSGLFQVRLLTASQAQALVETEGAGLLWLWEFAGSEAFSSCAKRTSGIAATVAIEPLTELTHEAWVTDDRVERYEVEGVEIAHAGDLAMLRVVLDEHSLGAEGEHALARAAFEGYRRLFSTIRLIGLRSILRLWNFVPSIVAPVRDNRVDELDRERYRQFNIGRHAAFLQFSKRDGEFVRPAATGVGAAEGPLVIDALVAATPARMVENPRQVPAYAYPRHFGTRAPAFSRATLRAARGMQELYLSGTASIVGSDTCHVGDVTKQVLETLRNIQAVGSAAARLPGGTTFELEDFDYLRVYVKHAEDLPEVRRTLNAEIGSAIPTCWLRQDICRPELLCEVEGVARVPMPR